MAIDIDHELLGYLTAIEAIERQSLRLMRAGIEHAGDEAMAHIYRTHRRQTERHAAILLHRIAALQAHAPRSTDARAGLAGIEVHLPPQLNPATVAVAAYAHENLEIAAYHLLRALAQRAGDQETIEAVDEILEQEEAAAEVLASRLDRSLEVTIKAAPQ